MLRARTSTLDQQRLGGCEEAERFRGGLVQGLFLN